MAHLLLSISVQQAFLLMTERRFGNYFYIIFLFRRTGDIIVSNNQEVFVTVWL